MNIYIVDAFSNTPFRGNPAAVCILDIIRSDDWMQKVANEMNLSETAFLFKKDHYYNLRWFTPEAEVDLCGHATLASAHILWEEEICSSPEISFSTKSGILKVTKGHQWIHMDFPLEIAIDCISPRELIEGLGIPLNHVAKNRLDFIVEIENEDLLRNLQPNFNLLKKISGRGVIVTSRSSNPSYDFVSRCFYPSLGVNEDPVTGSAHCGLGSYWMTKLKKKNLKAMQLSERQGYLQLKIETERIIISGQAVTTMKGELLKS